MLVEFEEGHMKTSSIPSSTIDSDAAEISKLTRDFNKYSPESIHVLQEASCHIMLQCCPHNRSALIAMALSGDLEGVAKQCFGDVSSPDFLSNMEACSPLTSITTLTANPQIPNYFSTVIKKSQNDKREMNIIVNVCSEKEIYAISCEWKNSAQHDSCQRKVLQRWADENDDIAYTDKVEQKKKLYIKTIDELKREFKT